MSRNYFQVRVRGQIGVWFFDDDDPVELSEAFTKAKKFAAEHANQFVATDQRPRIMVWRQTRPRCADEVVGHAAVFDRYVN